MCFKTNTFRKKEVCRIMKKIEIKDIIESILLRILIV